MDIKELFEKITNFIALFYLVDGIVMSVILALYIIGEIFYEPTLTSLLGYYPSNTYILILNAIIAISSILVGFGLLSRLHLSRIGAILLAVPKLLSVPIGTVIGITIIVLMVSPYANKIFGEFSKKKLPYRVIGITIAVLGFFSFAYLSGYAQSTYERFSINMFGYPEYNIDPMQKIKLDNLYGEKDVIVELTAPVGTYAIEQQNLVIQDIISLGGFVEDQYYYTFNGLHVKIDGFKLKELASNPYVRAIYPNYPVTLHFGDISNVHCLDECNNLLNTDWLWSHGYTGKGVVVAVIDSGINEDMEWLQRNGSSIVIASYEKYYDYLLSPDAFFMNHGTLVASCIASQNPEYKGVAPDVNLIDVEIFTLYDVDEDGDLETVAFIDDILWGYEQVAKFKQEHPEYFVIASCSFGYPAEKMGDTWSNPAPTSAGANNLAMLYGIPVVASAGNGAERGEHISSPASAQYVLGVGAVDKYLVPASFSSEGPTPDGHRKPDVSNIGVCVVTFDHDGTLSFVDGTSFSCPLTSGILADLATKHKDLQPTDFYKALKESANDISPVGFDYKTGYGFVDGVEASQIIGKITPTKVYIAIAFASIFIGVGIVFYPEWGHVGLFEGGGSLWRKKK